MTHSEKISADEVEVVNSSENPEKITVTKIKADEEYKENQKKNPFEGAGFAFGGGAANGEDNPLMKMMGNVEEIKKIKPYFLFALLFGFIALFGFRIYMAPLALLFGALDLLLGSKLTKNASYTGMIFAILGLMLEFG
jgi:hypothetical protein